MIQRGGVIALLAFRLHPALQHRYFAIKANYRFCSVATGICVTQLIFIFMYSTLYFHSTKHSFVPSLLHFQPNQWALRSFIVFVNILYTVDFEPNTSLTVMDHPFKLFTIIRIGKVCRQDNQILFQKSKTMSSHVILVLIQYYGTSWNFAVRRWRPSCT